MKKVISVVMITTLMLISLVGCAEEKEELDSKLSEFHEAVKAAYGDDYMPDMEIEEGLLKEKIGLTDDMYTDFIAEGPMTSDHIDTFIAIEATADYVDEVETLLVAYRMDLQSDSGLQVEYEDKLAHAEIIVRDNYVFFIMLGENEDDIQIAIDAIDSKLE